MYITRSFLGPKQFHQCCSFLQDGMEMKKMQVSVQSQKDTLLIWMQICSGQTDMSEAYPSFNGVICTLSRCISDLDSVPRQE